MKIKEVSARVILDSRNEKTIEVSVNFCTTSSPSGKSTGKYEKPCYIKNIKNDVDFINKLGEHPEKIKQIFYFGDLIRIEKILKGKVGANTLFAFEASVLKALAQEKKQELWQVVDHKLKFNIKNSKFPRILSNTIGGGAHSHSKIKPDFQEFLVVANRDPRMASIINKKSHEEVEKLLDKLSLNSLTQNDEHAWNTDKDNEGVLDLMSLVKKNMLNKNSSEIDLGLDCAASQFYNAKTGKYEYKNRQKKLTREEQIKYITYLAKKYNLVYIEDPLDEEDFQGFSELVKNLNCLIVGDDLTVTNLKRTEKAIKMEAITAIIIKPNQIGSLIEAKRVVDLCKKKGIKIIVSHRSGETLDSTIADFAFGWQADYIKIPVVGEERLAKVKRLIEIEESLK